MSLHDRLVAFLKALDLAMDRDWQADTLLITSGLLDSLALLNLAVWIEQEIGTEFDPTTVDLPKEWDTIDAILSFIETHRKRNCVE